MSKVQGFEAYETIGIGILNPRAVTRTLVPKDLTPEQLADLEAFIDKYNAEADRQLKAEIAAEEALWRR
jgi:hypothetical protein